jgi:hypothetical protein
VLAARVGDIVMPDIVEVAVEQTSCVEEPALLISKGGVAGDSRGGGHRAGIGDVGAVMAARERDLWIRGFAYGERVSGRDDGDFGMEVRDVWGSIRSAGSR